MYEKSVPSLILLLACCTLCGCGTETAGSTVSAMAANEAAESAATPAAPGPAAQRIYLDPATGKPRDPTSAELQADAIRRNPNRVGAQSARATAEAVTATVLPNGLVEVNVGSRGRHELRVCRQPDGRFAECTQQQAEAAALSGSSR